MESWLLRLQAAVTPGSVMSRGSRNWCEQQKWKWDLHKLHIYLIYTSNSTWLHYEANNYWINWQDSWGKKTRRDGLESPGSASPSTTEPTLFPETELVQYSLHAELRAGTNRLRCLIDFDRILRASSEIVVVPPHGTLSQVTVYETYRKIGLRENLQETPTVYLKVQNTVFVDFPSALNHRA